MEARKVLIVALVALASFALGYLILGLAQPASPSTPSVGEPSVVAGEGQVLFVDESTLFRGGEEEEYSDQGYEDDEGEEEHEDDDHEQLRYDRRGEEDDD